MLDPWAFRTNCTDLKRNYVVFLVNLVRSQSISSGWVCSIDLNIADMSRVKLMVKDRIKIPTSIIFNDNFCYMAWITGEKNRITVIGNDRRKWNSQMWAIQDSYQFRVCCILHHAFVPHCILSVQETRDINEGLPKERSKWRQKKTTWSTLLKKRLINRQRVTTTTIWGFGIRRLDVFKLVLFGKIATKFHLCAKYTVERWFRSEVWKWSMGSCQMKSQHYISECHTRQPYGKGLWKEKRNLPRFITSKAGNGTGEDLRRKDALLRVGVHVNCQWHIEADHLLVR